MGEFLFATVAVIAGLFLLFLLLRELFCWYWKINRIVTSLDEISESLSVLAAAQGDVSLDAVAAVACPECGRPIVSDDLSQEDAGENSCPHCGAAFSVA